MTTRPGPAATVRAGLVAGLVALVAVSAGCAPADTASEAAAGRVPASAPSPDSRPTPRPAAQQPSVTARPADLPAVAAQPVVPSRLVIPAAEIDLPVVAVGVAPDGQMELPPDPGTVGWYRYGAGPADPAGSAVLGGHLDSREFGAGPLQRLRKVRTGDVVRVTGSDGSTTGYRITEVREVTKQKLPVDDLFDRTGPRRLQVVTCGGPYDADRGGYRDNLVLTAVPAD